MPRGGKTKDPGTVVLSGENFAIRCTLCGFQTKIAEKGDVKSMLTMRYAYQKLHGPGLCVEKKSAE